MLKLLVEQVNTRALSIGDWRRDGEREVNLRTNWDDDNGENGPHFQTHAIYLYGRLFSLKLHKTLEYADAHNVYGAALSR